MLRIIIKLNESIPCGYDALDKEYKFEIDGYVTNFFLPCIFEKEVNNDFDTPFALGLNEEKSEGLKFPEDFNWGFIQSYSTIPHSNAFQVFVENIMIDVQTQETDINDFLLSLKKWLRMFENFLKIHSSIKNHLTRTEEKEWALISVFVKNKNWKKIPQNNVHRMSVQLPSQEIFFDSVGFAKFLDLVSRNPSIPLEYNLYSEAIDAFIKEEFRRSIIESASAIELSLAQAVTNHPNFLMLSEKTKKSEIKKYRMLGKIIEMCRKYGVDLLSIDFDNEVLGPRNSVAHKGYYPTEKEARVILKHSRVLLDKYLPL